MSLQKTLFVTGGAGFIGSALVRHLIGETAYRVVNIDKLTYAGHLANVATVSGSDRYAFEQVDICDAAEIARLFETYRPAGVLHLAAESHVDRSIDGPRRLSRPTSSARTRCSRRHSTTGARWTTRHGQRFAFCTSPPMRSTAHWARATSFTEETPYAPNSPYSATKAASDHLVRAWHHTYGLPVVTTNCSNNYGPYQYPEKLIPVVIQKAVAGQPIPVYGKGANVRDWLYVDDHARALVTAFEKGAPGETYNVGGHNEKTNLDVVQTICRLLDEKHPARAPHERLITFVTDRPGHDFRYAIDASKIERDLGWTPRETFETGLAKTVEWYLDHQEWIEQVTADRYALERLGTTS